MTLLDLAKTLFTQVEFGPDFLIQLVTLVVILQMFQIVVDMVRGRSWK